MNIQRIIQRCWFLCAVLMLGVTIIDAAEESGRGGRQRNNALGRVNSRGSAFGDTVDQRLLYQKRVQELEQQVSLHNDQLLQLEENCKQQVQELQKQLQSKNTKIGQIETEYTQQLNSFMSETKKNKEELELEHQSSINQYQSALSGQSLSVSQLACQLNASKSANVMQSTEIRQLKEREGWLTRNLELEQQSHKKTLAESEEGQKSLTRLDNIIANLNSVLTRYQIIIAFLSAAVCVLVLDRGGYMQISTISF